jgi:hypothetical protein
MTILPTLIIEFFFLLLNIQKKKNGNFQKKNLEITSKNHNDLSKSEGSIQILTIKNKKKWKIKKAQKLLIIITKCLEKELRLR